VLDPWCRSHDVENLFVVDSSFFASSAVLNPVLTIAAQALRVADQSLLGADGVHRGRAGHRARCPGRAPVCPIQTVWARLLSHRPAPLDRRRPVHRHQLLPLTNSRLVPWSGPVGQPEQAERMHRRRAARPNAAINPWSCTTIPWGCSC